MTNLHYGRIGFRLAFGGCLGIVVSMLVMLLAVVTAVVFWGGYGISLLSTLTNR